MAAVSAEVHGPSDAELITAVREGDVRAYGSLYERHVTSAYNLARQLARSTAEADDLVSEAFAKVLDTLRGGRGPDSAFRAYLLTALRHVAYDKTRRDRKVELTEDVTTVSGMSTEKISEPFKDTAVAGLERSLAAKAFARLPERWQAVLWHTEIEGQSPAEVAPLLGLTANGVSALAYRAREGLRQAYLQVHLAETTENRCRDTVHKLGAWTRGGLSKRETTQVETHLDECDRCRALAAELAEVNGSLRIFIAPLVLGAGATGYLALTAGAAKATAAGVTVAGLSAGAAAGAGAGSSSGGGAAGAASALPRQFLGVGASVAALAAALVIALTGANTQQLPPAAAQPSPPAPTHAQPPANNPPAAPKPNPPKPSAPKPQAPAPSAPAPSSAPPAPQPTLHASGPSQPITLTPGGGPVDLPITVQNTGQGPSQPVTAALNLPPGVSAVGPSGSSGSTHPSAATVSPQSSGHTVFADDLVYPRNHAKAQPVADSTGGQVACPGGTGRVSCSSPSGLQPGQSVVLMFRVEAAPGTKSGTITGTISSNSEVSVQVAVQVTVPPAPQDGLSLTAHQVNDQSENWLWNWDFYPLLDITATNTGGTTKPLDITVDRTGTQTATSADPPVLCQGDEHQTDCRTLGSVDPGQTVHLRIRLYDLPYDPRNDDGHDTVTVTGQLGSATQTVSVPVVECPWALPWPGEWASPPTPPGESMTDPSSPTRTTTRTPTVTLTPPSLPLPTGPTAPSGPATSPTTSTPDSTEPPSTTSTPSAPAPTSPTCSNTGDGPGGGHVRPGGPGGLCDLFGLVP